MPIVVLKQGLLALGACRSNHAVPSQACDCTSNDRDSRWTLEPLRRYKSRAGDDAPKRIRGERSTLTGCLDDCPLRRSVDVADYRAIPGFEDADVSLDTRLVNMNITKEHRLTKKELPYSRIHKTCGRGVETTKDGFGNLVLPPGVVNWQQRELEQETGPKDAEPAEKGA